MRLDEDARDTYCDCRAPDEKIMRIVDGWPQNFAPDRAKSLGFPCDATFEDIVRIRIADELTPPA